ncbi:MAG: hypothetical protein AVDCRST_MAG32-821 [uncultured Nocardioides sp.]|uniref:Uncharacterized protein n=1 Tax=uncultured Nocardioides sp. TaxID=198441 RepID=A0A6J4N3U8_9ACTN|nr:MAG: hypothetical protein AVDCRST_MAG32-821 [uncultured Nocardioides sp.]
MPTIWTTLRCSTTTVAYQLDRRRTLLPRWTGAPGRGARGRLPRARDVHARDLQDGRRAADPTCRSASRLASSPDQRLGDLEDDATILAASASAARRDSWPRCGRRAVTRPWLESSSWLRARRARADERTGRTRAGS